MNKEKKHEFVIDELRISFASGEGEQFIVGEENLLTIMWQPGQPFWLQYTDHIEMVQAHDWHVFGADEGGSMNHEQTIQNLYERIAKGGDNPTMLLEAIQQFIIEEYRYKYGGEDD